MKTLVATIAILLLYSTSSISASIVNSKHNLSLTSAAGIHSTTQSQICIFCHSPHSSMSLGPLWNRLVSPLGPDGYLLYTASNTLTPAAKAAKFNNSSVSMLCLSCHSGELADIGARVSNPLGNPMTMVDTFVTWPSSGVAWDGRSIANHPVGFDYALAQSQKPSRLRTTDQVKTALGSTAFFNSTASEFPNPNSVECSTCHTVHNPANAQFLRISNAGNALCLTCHIML